MKNYILPILCITLFSPSFADSESLSVAINNTKMNCEGISGQLSGIKTMAAVNTVITGAGTVAGGAGVAVGIKKAKTDKSLTELDIELNALKDQFDNKYADADYISYGPELEKEFTEYLNKLQNKDMPEIDDPITKIQNQKENQKEKQKEIQSKTNAANEKSKKQGNIRTGMMATNTATNIASTIIAANNKIDDELKSKIEKCLASVNELQDIKMQARLDGAEDTDTDMQTAESIIYTCGKYNVSDIDKINSKSTGAAISGMVGIATGGTATATSALANRKSTKTDNSEQGEKKEAKLNKTSNILGAGATSASFIGTLFNASQISAAKNLISTANACEGALK